jgi:hypothetical protein
MFRFTVRELVLLTLVVALAVAWWIEHRQLTAAMRRLAAAEAELALLEPAINQTGLALYELGIHWRFTNGRLILRPWGPNDGGPPVEGLKGEPPIQPNFDISQFAGQRMPGPFRTRKRGRSAHSMPF